MKNKIFALCALSAFALTLFFAACSDKTETNDYYFAEPQSYSEYKLFGSTQFEGRGKIMGADALLRISDENNFSSQEEYDRAIALWQDIKRVLIDTNASISATVKNSCISRFNAAEAGAKVEIDKTAYDVFTLAKSVYIQTEGYYNPAVYDSLRLFGFTLDGREPYVSKLPDGQDINAFRELSSHFDKVELSQESGKYYARKPAETVTVGGVEYSLKVDLGGIGKGWCADIIDEMTSEAGFEYGFFSFSSSSMAVKKYTDASKNNEYTLRIRDPRDVDGAYFEVKCKDRRLSTSGDYEKYYLFDGERYCHIIDPTTGAPIKTGVASVTVIGGDAAEDDAYTTALSAMGKERAVNFINENLSNRKVVALIFEDGAGKIITNCPQDIKITNENYTLANTVADGKIVLN